MSYINKITVGGEVYNLTPSFNTRDKVYAVDSNGNIVNVYPLSTYLNGELYPNLATYNSEIYGLRTPGNGIICGLGANGEGAVGLYVFTGGGHMSINSFPNGSLARMAMSIDGAIGVCTSGTDGIYANDATGCISLKLKTEPVTLQSGEMLRIYISPEGFLELVRV